MPVKKTQTVVITIFGASGDLAQIKLFPALYELAAQKKLPERFCLFGYGRTALTRAEFQKLFADAVKKHCKIKPDKKILQRLLAKLHYFSGQYDQLPDFEKLLHSIQKIARAKHYTHIAYFSVPPIAFQDIVRNLALSRARADDDIRLIIEKPFGEDKKSAERLFHFVSQFFSEDQFYLLDHYLGKSSVRSILQLRYSNRILHNILRGSEIANIQITAAENYGVDQRVGYFDQVGIVRDMMQSHLLQIVSLLTMSIPVTKDAASLQREKNAILSAIDCPCDNDNIILGQYSGYKKHKGVKKNSKTETFAALRLFIDREEWYEVPIYLRAGKQLHEKHTYIVIEFKKYPFQAGEETPNRLVLELYPYERINITLLNKHEDVERYQDVRTVDSIACEGDGCLPEHAMLLLDVIKKDKIHFLSFAEILSAWSVIDEAECLIKHQRTKVERYSKGSIGPRSQQRLPAHDGFLWYDVHEESNR